MKSPFIAALVSLALLSACATGSRDNRARVAGHYVTTGFNESLVVDLADDGSYVMEDEWASCAIGPNGELPAVTHSKETGIWRSENGVVSLDPKARVGEFPTLPNFLPAYARKLIPQRQGVSRLLVNADHPKDFILKETKSPNRVAGSN